MSLQVILLSPQHSNFQPATLSSTFVSKKSRNTTPSMGNNGRSTSARGRIRSSPYSSGSHQVRFPFHPRLFSLVFAGTTFVFVHRPWKPSTTKPSLCRPFFKTLYNFAWRSKPCRPHSGTGKRISQTISWSPFLHYTSHDSGRPHRPCFSSHLSESARSFS